MGRWQRCCHATPSSATLSVLCQSYGCDFMIQDGKVYVDARDEIDRRLPR